MTKTPTHPDSDGIYEDTNGNGRIDFADITLYFSPDGMDCGKRTGQVL